MLLISIEANVSSPCIGLATNHVDMYVDIQLIMQRPPPFNLNLKGLSCTVNIGRIRIKYTVSNIFDYGD